MKDTRTGYLAARRRKTNARSYERAFVFSSLKHLVGVATLGKVNVSGCMHTLLQACRTPLPVEPKLVLNLDDRHRVVHSVTSLEVSPTGAGR